MTKIEKNNLEKVVKKIEYKKILSRKNTIFLSLFTFLFSIIFYFGLFKSGENPFGLSIFLLEILFLIINFKFFGKKINILKNYSLLFGIILALITSFWFVIFTNNFFSISFFIILIILNLFIVFNTKETKFKLFGKIGDYFFNFLNIIGDSLDGIGFSIKELKNSYFGKKGIINNKTNLKNFGIGILILFLLLSVILPLLASADKIFSKYLDNFLNIFSFLENESILNLGTNLLEYGFFISSIFIIFFSIFLFIPNYSIKLEEEKDKKYKKLNNIIYSVIIYGLNFVYFLFILIQFRYIFFGNQELFKSLDITYASYIHQGFYQLMIVAGINYLLYKFFYKRISKESSLEKFNLLLLLIFTIIISYSALTRIFLYIEAYNLTILRFFVVYISILIIILFTFNIYILYSKNNKIINYFYYLVLISFVGIGYLNIESYIANYNINNYKQSISKHLDKNYIKNLSADAIKEKRFLFPKEDFTRNGDTTIIQNILNYNYFYRKLDPVHEIKIDDKFWNNEKIRIQEFDMNLKSDE